MKQVVILSLLMLTSCVSQTVEQIQSDPENIQKAQYVQNKVNIALDAEINRQKNNADYVSCVSNVKQLKAINNKNHLVKYDMETILKIVPDIGRRYNGEESCKLDYEYRNIELEKEIDNFCYDKYWRGNWFTATTLFPLRMTNELLTFGTLGAFPALTGSCESKGKMPRDIAMGCWKPGATWNYDTCTEFLSGINHSMGSDKLSIKDNYWNSYNTNADDVTFTEADFDELTKKMNKFCDNPTNINPYANKLCKGDFTKGCLIDLDGLSVATFGTRDNGVIVSFRLFGFELAIGDQVFVYDSRDYYDGQKLKTSGYYYKYVGNYDDTLQKLPAFKRSEYKIHQETIVDDWCRKGY